MKDIAARRVFPRVQGCACKACKGSGKERGGRVDKRAREVIKHSKGENSLCDTVECVCLYCRGLVC